ncbi:hypothetical protein [Aureimonas sp. AU12]|uniref:hypothetical protein n=1 Tax=Aureimonas sp. AU12 TaxID=1638161 RepID=UPI000782523F|nr:hypothetical protein [Aureimonas sp. AU12]
MSNTPNSAAQEAPDLEAEELAAKHNISLDEAKGIIADKGHDRGTKDGTAGQMKADDAAS